MPLFLLAAAAAAVRDSQQRPRARFAPKSLGAVQTAAKTMRLLLGNSPDRSSPHSLGFHLRCCRKLLPCTNPWAGVQDETKLPGPCPAVGLLESASPCNGQSCNKTTAHASIPHPGG